MGLSLSDLWSNQEENDYFEDSSYSESEEEDNEDQSTDNIENITSSPVPHELQDNICFDSATDTVDAVPPKSTTIRMTLNLDQVLLIENKLENYEKVSLVYLLYEDPSSALHYLLKLINGNDEKLIYKWSMDQNIKQQKWQEKLIEAICIIQNYEVLRYVGFNKQDLTVSFLPRHSFIVVHVSKFRKALYHLCEEFDRNDVEQLVHLVNSDFQRRKLNFKVFDSQFLEMYLLYWETIGYVKQDDLTYLCSSLKQMDQLDLCDKLKELFPVKVQIIPEKAKTVDGNKKSKSLIEEILNPTSSVAHLVSLESNSNISADNAAFTSMSNKYFIDPQKPGVCLIINQENFYREIDPKLQHLLPPFENKLESRKGTEHDKEKLVKTFMDFGFKVVTADNLIHSDVIKKIDEVMQTITDESSFFLCIMSHGDEGIIYGVNSCRVLVKNIKKIMVTKNRTHLSGKPKVLILQSCQGTRCQRLSSSEQDDDIVIDGPSSPSETVPPCADLFTFWATVPGYGAIRNKKTGSWFIQSLCDKMKSLGDCCHFDDICTAVIDDVSSRKWCQIKEEVAMVPLKDSTFRKYFYLPPTKMMMSK